jgi:hypothetical protein
MISVRDPLLLRAGPPLGAEMARSERVGMSGGRRELVLVLAVLWLVPPTWVWAAPGVAEVVVDRMISIYLGKGRLPEKN